MKTKKGLSPIITTILLILIALIAVLFIYSVVVPFVKDLLSNSRSCYATQGQLEINTVSGYTCYYQNTSSQKNVNITIARGMEDAGIEGFIITIHGDGRSEQYTIKEEYTPGVLMYGPHNEVIEVPGIGEEITYSLTTSFQEITRATVTPLVPGNACEEGIDDKTLEECAAY